MSIPRIKIILENSGGKKYFSTLDMSKVYPKSFMHENSQQLTTVTFPRNFTSGLGYSSVSTIYKRIFVRTRRLDMNAVP